MTVDVVEEALAYAISRAVDAGLWAQVGQLARELETRRIDGTRKGTFLFAAQALAGERTAETASDGGGHFPPRRTR